MSDLSDYRAAIKRLIEADDTNEAFENEGFGGSTAAIIRGSKSFTASQSASRDKVSPLATEYGKMSHRQKKRNLA